MSERERLIALLFEANDVVKRNGFQFNALVMADYLLKHGVIVPPVKVGDTVYYIHEWGGKVYEGEVISLVYASSTNNFGIHYDGGYGIFGRYVFLTREEAEAALAERSNK